MRQIPLWIAVITYFGGFLSGGMVIMWAYSKIDKQKPKE